MRDNLRVNELCFTRMCGDQSWFIMFSQKYTKLCLLTKMDPLKLCWVLWRAFAPFQLHLTFSLIFWNAEIDIWWIFVLLKFPEIELTAFKCIPVSYSYRILFLETSSLKSNIDIDDRSHVIFYGYWCFHSNSHELYKQEARKHYKLLVRQQNKQHHTLKGYKT